MIKRKRGLFIIALLTLLVALLIQFPARVAYQLASPPHVAMRGLTGTVWNGSAGEFSTNGVYLRELEWQIQPLRLFTGEAVYTVSGSPISGFFDSEVAIDMGGTVSLVNLAAVLPLQMFADAVGVPGLKGNASLKFERLVLDAGRPTAMDGSVDVAGLLVPMVSRVPLGGYRAEFFTQNSGIAASVEDTDGVVDLAGSLQIRPDKTYTFLGQVVAKPNTPDSLREQLSYLPESDRKGQHELRLEGSY